MKPQCFLQKHPRAPTWDKLPKSSFASKDGHAALGLAPPAQSLPACPKISPGSLRAGSEHPEDTTSARGEGALRWLHRPGAPSSPAPSLLGFCVVHITLVPPAQAAQAASVQEHGSTLGQQLPLSSAQCPPQCVPHPLLMSLLLSALLSPAE